MSKKRELSHWVEVEEEDGKKNRYAIYRQGKSTIISGKNGFEHILHPAAQSIESEIRLVFKAKVIRTIMPWENIK